GIRDYKVTGVQTCALPILVEGDLGFTTLTWISGYDRITEVNRADLDFSNPVQDPGGFLNFGIQVGQGQDLDDKIYSEELRFTSRSEERRVGKECGAEEVRE